jgi:hypothetical protein
MGKIEGEQKKEVKPRGSYKKRGIPKRTLKDFYKHYDYPCWDLSLLDKNIVPLPYIPKEKVVCDHKYSLTYKQYKRLYHIFAEELFKYLLKGYTYEIPNYMGNIDIRRFKKPYSFIDWPHYHKTGELKKVYNLSKETQGFRPFLKWDNGYKICRLKFKKNWKINFPKSKWMKITKFLEDDLSNINNFNDL